MDTSEVNPRSARGNQSLAGKVPLRASGLARRARLPAYGLAVVVTLVTLGARMVFAPWFGDHPGLILFVLPILLSSFAGGMGPGLVSTTVAVLGAAYIVLLPTFGVVHGWTGDVVQWLILLVSGVLISVLTQWLRLKSPTGPAATTRDPSLASERKVQRGFGFALFFVGVIGVFSILSISHLRVDTGWETHTEKVISSLRLLLSTVTDVETAERGFVITGVKDYLEPYNRARLVVGGELRELRDLTADNLTQQQQLDRLEPLIAERLSVSEEQITLRREQGLAAAQESVESGRGKQIHDRIRGLVAEMEATERGLLVERGNRTHRTSVATRTIIIGGGTLSFLLVVGALVIMKQEFAVRHRTEADLREAHGQLEAANKELEAFSYSVSHDLRSPLRAVDGFSRIVLEDYGPQLPPQGQHYLENIRQGAQQMGKLIDDLLTFSRLSRGALVRQTVDMTRLVREVLEGLSSMSEGRQVEIRQGAMPAAEGDPALLKQVWINLLSNALKYTRNRPAAVIEIGCNRVADENIYFVRDNGTGFDMQYAPKLFGVFQRLHRQEEFEGTGVGLAIVKRIVQRHGGRVWAEAAVDHGAVFYFTLQGETKSCLKTPTWSCCWSRITRWIWN